MPISEARKRANKKWNDANMKDRYDRVQLVIPKGLKELWQSAAQKAGLSLNAYITEAVEAKRAGGGYGNSGTDSIPESVRRSLSHTEASALSLDGSGNEAEDTAERAADMTGTVSSEM